MNQEWLIQNVLKYLDAVPDTPADDRAYLSLDESQRIVDETVDYLGKQGDETEYIYVRGHRKRLAHSLSMIPIARQSGESCLDVGSYGYMALWAKKYLGYSNVIGIEWHPDVDDEIIHRTLTLNGESVELRSYNFDISKPGWMIEDSFDTVLFFEVLEHINEDPMGVMERIHERLTPEGTLVMSVPNAISYKAFKEFLVGMPPWTYWFYKPDLSHEPRHCFEYTPIIFKTLIQASGMRENAFRTIYAYTDPEHEQETLEIARSLGFKDESFGETMIINATKTAKSINLRHPDVLYSPDGYYRNVYPHLHDRFARVIAHFRKSNSQQRKGNADHEEQINQPLFTCDTQLHKHEELQSQIQKLEIAKAKIASKLQQTRDWAHDLEQEKHDLESKVNDLLFTCDCYLRKESEQELALQKALEAESAARKAAQEARIVEVKIANDAARAAKQEAQHTRTWAEDLAKENADLRGQVNELLFACDCYLQQVNDPNRCVQVIRERRFRSALRVSKSIARKTPIIRTALRPVYRETKKFIKKRM